MKKINKRSKNFLTRVCLNHEAGYPDNDEDRLLMFNNIVLVILTDVGREVFFLRRHEALVDEIILCMDFSNELAKIYVTNSVEFDPKSNNYIIGKVKNFFRNHNDDEYISDNLKIIEDMAIDLINNLSEEAYKNLEKTDSCKRIEYTNKWSITNAHLLV